MLPKITITLGNGGPGQTAQTNDGIAGLVLSGVAVANKLVLDTGYLLTKIEDAEALGIESTGVNAYAYKQTKQFFDIAGAGAQLYILVTAASVNYVCDNSNNYAKKLLNYASGSIRILGVSIEKPITPTIANGLQQEVHTAATNAQVLANAFESTYKPVRIVLDGVAYSGTVSDLKDYKTTTLPNVAILLSGEDTGGNADVGAAIGTLSVLPVQRKLSRVANGAVPAMDSAYLTDDTDVDDAVSNWDAIHAKGYIFHRTHVGKSGYYFSSDVTATADTSDYNSIARGRTIDKALTLTYGVMLDKLSDEIDINADGTISPALAKTWEQDVEDTLNLQMTANEEVSAVQVVLDTAQNVLSTNRVEVGVRIQPKGYADFIDVNLGFTIQTV